MNGVRREKENIRPDVGKGTVDGNRFSLQLSNHTKR